MFDVQHASATIHEFFTTTATALARATKFVQRESKLTGPGFVQTLVFGFLDEPQATLNDLAQTSAELGVTITPQGLDERLTSAAVTFLKQMFQQSMALFRNTTPLDVAFLTQFPAVEITDSTVIALPPSLQEEFPGCGGDGPAAAVKVQLVFDYLHGNLEVVEWQAGRTPDQNYTGHLTAGPAGALHLHDLGYFKLTALQQTAARAYFFSRLLTSTTVLDADGTPVDLLDWVRAAPPGADEREILLGADERIPCRLIWVPVPEAVVNERRRKAYATAQRKGRTPSKRHLALLSWSFYVTTLPATVLTIPQALILASVRWQVELIFKLWKSYGRLARVAGLRRERVLGELYAKMIGLVLTQGLIAPQRLTPLGELSPVKALRVCQRHALAWAQSLADRVQLESTLDGIVTKMLRFGQKEKRKKHIATCQKLLAMHSTA
ncbi:MAG: IS4 family transposase [Chloroflexi bacterium]|nr:IS4 family transposase [Chloroflexota bacterium]MBU1748444.1 IS4 family transposase [Chloroflexota bacterium]